MQLLKERRRLLWCHNPKPIYENDSDKWDRYYIPARTIALLRQSVDVIILPSDNQQLKDFASFCTQALRYQARQVIWTSGTQYIMDKDIKQELLPQLRSLTMMGKWRIVPYSVTEIFNEWARELRVPIFGDSETWVDKYSDKTILHPRINNPNTPSLFAQHVKSVKIPAGYSCSNKKDLLAAFDRLRGEGLKGGIMLKPALGSTGVGIIEISNKSELESYKFPLGDVVLEEKIIIDTDSQGQIMAPSVQYTGEDFFAGITDQIIKGVTFSGNIFPAQIPSEAQQNILATAQEVLQWLKPKGPGGMDFLLSKGQPYLIDPNIGRFTGAHPARLFQSMYAPGTCFLSWKIEPRKNVFEFWEELRKKGIALRPRRSHAKGVFPLCYLQGMWGMLVAFANTVEELKELQIQAESCL